LVLRLIVALRMKAALLSMIPEKGTPVFRKDHAQLRTWSTSRAPAENGGLLTGE
jgi:hypothetical protein